MRSKPSSTSTRPPDPSSPSSGRFRSSDPLTRACFLLVLAAIAGSLASSGFGCGSFHPQAVGPNGEVTLITDLDPDGPAVLAVRATLGRPIATVRPEPAFELMPVPGTDFNRYARDRNLVLLADLSSPGPTADRIRELSSRIGGSAGTGEASPDRARPWEELVLDPWARGQTVLVLAAQGEVPLAQAIAADGERIYRRFEDAVTAQTGVLLFAGGDQGGVQRELGERYGWSMRIPKGYRVGSEPSAGFVRFFMREGGARLLFVHWRDGVRDLPSPDSCLALRAELAARFYTGDFVDFGRSAATAGHFLGHQAYRLAGVWQNDLYTMGGPFRTYCFLDRDRMIMIDLAVFEPTASKVELLRQLEAIARTYRDLRPAPVAHQGGP